MPSPAQDTPSARPICFGVETALNSGHADRGFVISDRPVIQPEVDILKYRGVYFGEAGIKTGRRVSQRVDMGGYYIGPTFVFIGLTGVEF